jgi:biotin synthase
MCYAIPGKVKSVDGNRVIVDYFGEEKNAISELPDLHEGDHIYAQAGYVIEKIPTKEAEQILAVWKETFFELQEADLKLSQIDFDDKNKDKKVSNILDKCLSGIELKKEDLLYLLNSNDKGSSELIQKTANFLRHKAMKNSCCVHGIIEISNNCALDCSYCGIASSNKNIERYKMSVDEVIETALEAITKYGFKALVLQSGEQSGYTIDELEQIIRTIRKKAGVFICISFGEVGLENLKTLYDAGARAILMRFETSNASIYKKLHPGCELETRIAHLKEADKLGYLIMTGALVGLPEQSSEDIVNDIMLAKELNAEMFSFGPFISHPDTVLAEHKGVSEDMMLKTLAIARLCDSKKAKILITTAFETISEKAREKGLMAGANSVMLNVTPLKYREQYAIYPDRKYSKETIENQIEQTIALLRSIGRAPTDLGMA